MLYNITTVLGRPHNIITTFACAGWKCQDLKRLRKQILNKCKQSYPESGTLYERPQFLSTFHAIIAVEFILLFIQKMASQCLVIVVVYIY